MDPVAFEAAKERLEDAGEALTQLQTALSFKRQKKAWRRFLIDVSAVYDKLNQGSQNNYPTSKQWYHGPIDKMRRQDPLLRYLKQAQNSDKHSISANLIGEFDHPSVSRWYKFYDGRRK